MIIQNNIDLLPYNTFHFSCIAKYFVNITKTQDIKALLAHKLFHDNHTCILWWGSNTLLTKDHFNGLVIKNSIPWKDILQEDDTSATIKVWAGESRDAFVRWSIKQWYTWIENLVSIPWTVGACPIQNIWAYGVEAKDSITEVTYIDLITWQTHTLSYKECHFWYRSSIFKQSLKNTCIITHVSFTLEKYNQASYDPCISYGAITKALEKQNAPLTPDLVAHTIASIRASKLPDRKSLGTAWSFFKNPIISAQQYTTIIQKYPYIRWYNISDNQRKLSAGQLIELAWCKGITEGHVGTYQNHALVLIHHGWWKGQEIVDLAQSIQQKVYTTFGIHIEPEVQYV